MRRNTETTLSNDLLAEAASGLAGLGSGLSDVGLVERIGILERFYHSAFDLLAA